MITTANHNSRITCCATLSGRHIEQALYGAAMFVTFVGWVAAVALAVILLTQPADFLDVWASELWIPNT